MKINNGPISLGQALALIEFETKFDDKIKPALNEDETIYLDSIKEKIAKIVIEQDNYEEFEQKDDEQLSRWVINIFFNSTQKESNFKIKRLNSSFQLFEKFNQVFIDYIMKSRDLKKETE